MSLTSKRAARLFRTAAITFTMLSPVGAARAQDDVILHAFTGGTDGAGPYGGLIADKEGNVFGTTLGGGDACHDGGCGTVFQIAPDDTETILYAFGNGKKFYLGPLAGLIADKDGNLYGTTVGGGNFNAYHCGNSGCGTVFELAPDGTETTLYAFEGKSDGSEPYAGLIRDKPGNLYGTTLFGGNANCHAGCGTVFRIAPDGTETVLYSFKGGSDGEYPDGGVIADKAGNLYGTTSAGGANAAGTAFKLSPDGKEKVLHAFTGGSGGAEPYAGLILGKGGNLYGTTLEGGDPSCACGTVFEIKK
jgi:uncharacterized repeat protein (TIGR03803 family)